MKVSKNILGFDHAIQTLIIGFALTSLIFALFLPFSLVFYLILQFVLGTWQVLSAFIIAMITGNKRRLQYLIAVVAFFANAGLISYLLRGFVFETEIAMGIIWLAIPAVYAYWYYKITQDDLKNFEELFINPKGKNLSSENIFNAKEFV